LNRIRTRFKNTSTDASHFPAKSKPDRYTFRPQSGDVFIVVGAAENLRIEMKAPSEKEA
jgi:hypothetical protein